MSIFKAAAVRRYGWFIILAALLGVVRIPVRVVAHAPRPARGRPGAPRHSRELLLAEQPELGPGTIPLGAGSALDDCYQLALRSTITRPERQDLRALCPVAAAGFIVTRWRHPRIQSVSPTGGLVYLRRLALLI